MVAHVVLPPVKGEVQASFPAQVVQPVPVEVVPAPHMCGMVDAFVVNFLPVEPSSVTQAAEPIGAHLLPPVQAVSVEPEQNEPAGQILQYVYNVPGSV